jgi:ATP-binding cassette subfamily B multidrug efflux pump
VQNTCLKIDYFCSCNFENDLKLASLKYLNKYFWKYRWRLIFGIICIAVSSWFAIFPAQLIRNGIDMVIEGLEQRRIAGEFALAGELESKIFYGAMVFGVLVIATALLRGLFTFLMRQTIIVMSRLIEYDLKNEIFEHYQKLSLSFYKKNKTGDMMNRISEDVSQVRMYIGPAVMYTVNLVIMFIMTLGTMIAVNAELTLYVILPLPLMSFAIYYVNSIINQRSTDRQKQLSVMSSFVQEAFSGIRVIKAYGRENDFESQFETQVKEYRNRSLNLVKVDALFFPIMGMLVSASVLLAIYVGGIRVMDGTITPGNIAEFILYVNMLTFPFISVGWVTSLMQRAAASQTRINEFLNSKPEIYNTPDSLDLKVQGTIEFKNVGFVYPESGVVALDGISFTVEQGKVLAILGRTGSGKSTIANLVGRLFDVTSGEILIDGHNVKTFKTENLRTSIGYVPQEVFLFSDTIFNNIGFGLNATDGTPEQQKAIVEQAAKDACVYDNIEEFPKKFQTLVGERGITLSGGQKQRISIARAIIKQPQILIFDDCLSAVDTETEDQILTNLNRVMHNKTAIIVSHRVSSVQMADHIIVLDEGKIIEAGSHKELINQQGAYADLYRKQLLEGRSEKVSES